jgi:hypothetical protein
MKRWYLATRLHGGTTYKTTFWIFLAVKTSSIIHVSGGCKCKKNYIYSKNECKWPTSLAWMIDNKNEAFSGMRIGWGNQSTWNRPALVPVHQPQIPRELNWDWIWTAIVRSQWLGGWINWSVTSFSSIQFFILPLGQITDIGNVIHL